MVNSRNYSIKELGLIANEVRISVIESLVEAKSGHSAGPLGLADVFTALYFKIMRFDPEAIDDEARDRFILSCGHVAPVLYATMAHRGFFPVSELKTLRKLGTRLQGHPSRLDLPGVENSSGPLGQGISIAVGRALGLKLKGNHSSRVYCVMSDGEQNEGQVWEAYMSAYKYKLNNLTIIIDRNNIQIDGFTEDVMPMESLVDKLKSFNLHTIEINGNDIDDVIHACREAQVVHDRPTVIIARTTPGKGVNYMENRYEWHGAPPGALNLQNNPNKKDQARIALHDLRTLRGLIVSEHE